MRYLAAYAGCALAESFAYDGRHALVVYDDLTRHAEAYRSLSLLLRRPPSREAYPGDIFFVQARLMERSFKLRRELGGGSSTALPILETQQGNISGFIPTNVISMTDGQIYLDATLFAEGHLPAIDVGRSVSRVGGSAQFRSLRDAASNLRIELSQYNEVRGFTRFGAILDETTKQQLRRGETLSRLLLQPERQPASLATQVAIFWAFKQKLLEDVPPDDIPAFEERLAALQLRFPNVSEALQAESGLTADARHEIEAWIAAAEVSRAGGVSLDPRHGDGGRPETRHREDRPPPRSNRGCRRDRASPCHGQGRPRARLRRCRAGRALGGRPVAQHGGTGRDLGASSRRARGPPRHLFGTRALRAVQPARCPRGTRAASPEQGRGNGYGSHLSRRKGPEVNVRGRAAHCLYEFTPVADAPDLRRCRADRPRYP